MECVYQEAQEELCCTDTHHPHAWGGGLVTSSEDRISFENSFTSIDLIFLDVTVFLDECSFPDLKGHLVGMSCCPWTMLTIFKTSTNIQLSQKHNQSPCTETHDLSLCVDTFLGRKKVQESMAGSSLDQPASINSRLKGRIVQPPKTTYQLVHVISYARVCVVCVDSPWQMWF